MNRNYDKFVDKQNQHTLDTAYKNKITLTPSSNKALRKKIDDNIISKEDQKYARLDKYAEETTRIRQKQKENVVFKEIHQNSNNRRQNARARGFDIHVTNIDNISDKISSLLGMIKKDKTALQKSEKDRERTFTKQNEYSPNVSLVDRIKKDKLVSSYDKEKVTDRSEHFKRINKEELLVDRESKSVHKVRAFNALEVVQEESKYKEDSKKQNKGKYAYDQQIKRDYSQSKYKKSTENDKIKSNWRQNMLKESISIAQYPIISDSTHKLKTYKKLDNRFPQNQQQNFRRQSKINDINDMYEQKRNERIRNRNQQNLKFQKSIKSEANLVEKWEQSDVINNSIIYKERNPSNNSLFQVFSQETFQENYAEQPSKNLYAEFIPMNFIKEGNNRTEKINTTTKLIDEQIRRIKSKIQESEHNNTKLKEKYRDNKEEEYPSKTHNENHTKSKYERQTPVQREKECISRMALKLSDQVQFDLRLKNARQFFEKNHEESKWEKLKYQTDKKGLNMSLNFLKQIMTMSSDEHNPFGNTANSKGLELKMQRIADLLSESQQNWQNYVTKCVSSKQLKEQSFQVTDLDLNKKGYLNIEDIVCFINLYSGQFYRNRDISLIFRRLQLESGQPGSKLSYGSFVHVFII